MGDPLPFIKYILPVEINMIQIDMRGYNDYFGKYLRKIRL